jgi:hypothetical protein
MYPLNSMLAKETMGTNGIYIYIHGINNMGYIYVTSMVYK